MNIRSWAIAGCAFILAGAYFVGRQMLPPNPRKAEFAVLQTRGWIAMAERGEYQQYVERIGGALASARHRVAPTGMARDRYVALGFRDGRVRLYTFSLDGQLGKDMYSHSLVPLTNQLGLDGRSLARMGVLPTVYPRRIEYIRSDGTVGRSTGPFRMGGAETNVLKLLEYYDPRSLPGCRRLSWDQLINEAKSKDAVQVILDWPIRFRTFIAPVRIWDEWLADGPPYSGLRWRDVWTQRIRFLRGAPAVLIAFDDGHGRWLVSSGFARRFTMLDRANSLPSHEKRALEARYRESPEEIVDELLGE